MTLTPATMSVDFVTGIYSAEDIASLPDSPWLVTSGMIGPDCQGHRSAVDPAALQATEIFPQTLAIDELVSFEDRVADLERRRSR